MGAYRLSVNIFNFYRLHDFDHSFGCRFEYNEIGNALGFAASIYCSHHIFASVIIVSYKLRKLLFIRHPKSHKFTTLKWLTFVDDQCVVVSGFFDLVFVWIKQLVVLVPGDGRIGSAGHFNVHEYAFATLRNLRLQSMTKHWRKYGF